MAKYYLGLIEDLTHAKGGPMAVIEGYIIFMLWLGLMGWAMDWLGY